MKAVGIPGSPEIDLTKLEVISAAFESNTNFRNSDLIKLANFLAGIGETPTAEELVLAGRIRKILNIKLQGAHPIDASGSLSIPNIRMPIPDYVEAIPFDYQQIGKAMLPELITEISQRPLNERLSRHNLRIAITQKSATRLTYKNQEDATVFEEAMIKELQIRLFDFAEVLKWFIDNKTMYQGPMAPSWIQAIIAEWCHWLQPGQIWECVEVITRHIRQ